MKPKADLVLHPVRMKIIQTLAGGKKYTALQLTELLPDIPQATMYRHLKILRDSGILSVVEKHQVRGTIEKVYALEENSEKITQAELQSSGREEHMHYFMKFVAGLLADYEKYLENDDIDLQKDGVSYRQMTVNLSDDEFEQFVKEVSAIYIKALQNEPSPTRKRRTISTIVIPEKGKK